MSLYFSLRTKTTVQYCGIFCETARSFFEINLYLTAVFLYKQVHILLSLYVWLLGNFSDTQGKIPLQDCSTSSHETTEPKTLVKNGFVLPKRFQSNTFFYFFLSLCSTVFWNNGLFLSILNLDNIISRAWSLGAYPYWIFKDHYQNNY